MNHRPEDEAVLHEDAIPYYSRLMETAYGEFDDGERSGCL